MAAPMCNQDDGNQATFLYTILANGDAGALCDEHMVMFSAAMLQSMTGIDPTPFIEALSDDSEPEPISDVSVEEFKEAALEAQPTPIKTTRSSGRTRAGSSEVPTDTENESDETTDEAPLASESA